MFYKYVTYFFWSPRAICKRLKYVSMHINAIVNKISLTYIAFINYVAEKKK